MWVGQVPPLQQATPWTCGPAALRALLAHYGHDVPGFDPASFENVTDDVGRGFDEGRALEIDVVRDAVEKARFGVTHIFGETAVDAPARGPLGGAELVIPALAEPARPAG